MDRVRVVLTFHSTTEAMAFERTCKTHNLPGRIIPMPAAISAQCGLAWLVSLEEKDYLVNQAAKLGLKYARIVELK